MTVTAPPRPPRLDDPVTHGEFDALVEALIEEARQRGQRRRRRNGAIVTLVVLVGVGLLAFFGRSAQSQTTSPAVSVRSSLPAAAASPKIAYISEPGGGYCGIVWVMNADGSGQHRLFTGGNPVCDQEAAPAWSPDGRRIAITRNPLFPPAPGAPYRGDSKIYVMNADGSEPRRLTNSTGFEFSPVWSPDGRRILFVKEGGAYVVNADGSHERRLTPLEAYGLSWSPDGRRILFAHLTDPGVQGNPSEVSVMNADGSGLRRLTRIRRGYFASPVWSPDGTRIVFGHNWQLWVMNADGSGQRQLTLKGAHNFNPAWSPDGRKIAFERGRRKSSSNHVGTRGREIHVMNADGSGQQRLTRGGSQPRWAPGGRIAYVSGRDGNNDIWIMNADGSGQRNLTRGTGRRESQPVWSPAQK